jgi:sugar phosphate isomerase/epimerase
MPLRTSASSVVASLLLAASCAGCTESPAGPATSPGSTGGLGGAAGTAAGSAAGGTSTAGVSSAGSSAATAGQDGAGGASSAGAGGGGTGGGGTGGGAVSGVDAWSHSPFIMDTWFWNDAANPTSAVALVKQTGFQGFALSADHDVTGYVAALDAAELPAVGIWVAVALDAYPDGVVASIASTNGLVLLSLNGGGFPISDAAGDTAALELIGKVADECQAQGLPGVALYPHVGFWMERVGDAVRLASKAARTDVGVVFNQYHWMAAEGGQNLETTLQAAEPYLKVVTLNGSEASASILPLGQGAYDVTPLLQALAKLDFRGSVGLQGYSISGDIAGKLQASKQTWDALVGSLAP